MDDMYKTNFRIAFKTYKRWLRDPIGPVAPLLVLNFTRYVVSPSLKKNYTKLLGTMEGGQVCFNSEEISDYIKTLDERPTGSVGDAYFKLFPPNHLLRTNLKRISSRGKEHREWIEKEHPYSWMARRYRDTHDIWHVLTGFPPDNIGEMRLAMFTFAQTGAINWFMLAFGFLTVNGINLKNIRIMLEAYKTGKQAKYLLAENYDKLLSEDLESARMRLNINANHTQN